MNHNIKALFQKILAILIIVLMLFADFALVGINAISYAIDMAKTNSNNVEFIAYFKDSKNEIVSSIDSKTNEKDLKIYIDVSVKEEGYFNGEIELEDTGFEFSSENTTNEYIKQIEKDKLVLNKIKAGDTVHIDSNIKFKDLDSIDKKLLNGENVLKLRGFYKNSKNEVEIDGTSKVNINWLSSDEEKALLEAKLLTNTTYKDDDKNKKIVQLMIKSKLERNSYPIKSTQIAIKTPEDAEDVKVYARSTDATSKNLEFNDNNYEYNPETNVVTINLKNEEVDGKIDWQKNKEDVIIVTYSYSDDKKVIDQDIDINSTITTFDDKEFKESKKVQINGEIDGIVTPQIIQNENEIFKGKLYTKENRYYTESTIIDINYSDFVKEINIKEDEAVFIAGKEKKQANIQYVESKILKSDFEEIFGKDGFITISDNKENVIKSIDFNTEVDSDGYFDIKYNQDIKSILINTSNPLQNGNLKIYHKKVILDNEYTRDEINELEGIEENIRSFYISDNTKKQIESESKTIKLLDIRPNAEIKLNVDKLYANDENKNVEIITTLKTNDESYDLYKNPIIEIKLPDEIKSIEGTVQYRVLNGNGLEEGKAIVDKEKNLITIVLKGKQENYTSEAIEGTMVQIRFNCTLSELVENKKAEFDLKVRNEFSEIEAESKETIDIITSTKEVKTKAVTLKAENESVLIQSIKAFVSGKELQDNEEVKSGEIIKYEITLENTGSTDAENVRVEGTVPDGTTRVKLEEVIDEEAELLLDDGTYPKYLDYVEKPERIVTFENINVEAGNKTKLEYEVRVNNDVTDNSVTSCNIQTTFNSHNAQSVINHTLKKANIILDLNVKSRKYGTVKSGYNYDYILSVTNNSLEDIEGLKLKVNINELIDVIRIIYASDETEENISSNQSVINIDKIKAGHTIYVGIVTLIKNQTENLTDLEISAEVVDTNNVTYKSNLIEENVETIKLSLDVNSTKNSNEEDNFVTGRR